MTWTNRINSGWTDERIDVLTKLWADGFSCSCIAAELGGVTRNAVIGKVMRLGLPKRKTVTVREGGGVREVFVSRTNNSRPRRRHRYDLKAFCGDPARIEARQADAEVRAEFHATEVVDLTPEQKAQAVTLLQLEPPHCRWPYGDPRKPEFVFCGCDRIAGSPYCAPHTSIATNGAAG